MRLQNGSTGSSILENAIASLTEEDIDVFLKQADEDKNEKIAVDQGSKDFEVRDYQVVDVAEKDNEYTVTYLRGSKPIPTSKVFDKAKIVQEGYEPQDVSVKDNNITVTFVKTDWHLKN